MYLLPLVLGFSLERAPETPLGGRWRRTTSHASSRATPVTTDIATRKTRPASGS